ncbi:phosphatidylinositol 4-phosphate 5-kinase-like protein 1 [Elgaria multicarinata webbii]|uniref:phosphatidylinositol 4-phosphate 5-kinase-like protein 1 n=1 Tax=Elgaria multicarinata webbii TaxID=159646 RepID=UPI002FCCF7A6
MQSIFYPHERIVERYDIKGCQLDRWSDAAPEGSEIIVVLKDLNFGENVICLDEQRAWFIQQVELDTQFLKDLDVMDYSLLVGLQPLHEDERILNKALANIIARTVSVSCKGSFCTNEPAGAEPKYMPLLPPIASTIPSNLEQSYTLSPESKSSIQDVLALYLSRRHSSEKDQEASTQSQTFMRDVLVPYLMRESGNDPASNSSTRVELLLQSLSLHSLEEDPSYILENRRLLPSCRNPLHVIDGPDYRYFIGIIDLFTVYSFRKKMEHLWKSIRYRGQNFSTVGPACYARRLCQWVEDHTT